MLLSATTCGARKPPGPVYPSITQVEGIQVEGTPKGRAVEVELPGQVHFSPVRVTDKIKPIDRFYTSVGHNR